jgi:hypothetical protein
VKVSFEVKGLMEKNDSLIAVLTCMVSLCLLLFSHAPTLAQEGKISLDFGDKTCSADVDQAPLRQVLEQIKEERGVWYKAWSTSHPALDEKISVRFEGLPIKEGFERLLSDVNHTLVFEGSSLVGVMIFGKPASTGYSGRTERRPIRRSTRRR